jgi:hypothetical protein
MPTLKGNRPRPRVALVGNFGEDVVKSLGMIFPTLWMGANLASLSRYVSPQEVDLIVIGPDTPLSDNDQRNFEFIASAHVICFSSSFSTLPGPSDNSSIYKRETSATEEYVISELPLGKFSLLEADLSSIDNAREWSLLDLGIQYRFQDSISDDAQREILFKGALLYDPHTELPFATIFSRLGSNLGVAWLPNNIFSIVPWVELICNEWAVLDPTRFPGFGDWTKNSEWMTNEELNLKLEIDDLMQEFDRLTADYKKRLSELKKEFSHTSLLVNKGKRRLITAQGNELLEEVARSFKELGYSVTIMDNELDEAVPKKEDLRLRDPDVEDWEAIVEVRGHTKSGGQTSDLNRLSKFARLYRTEKGREPNKLIYVVNGQIDLTSPHHRQVPFSSALDDVKAFGEQDGIILWTLDLYKVLKFARKEEDKAKFRKSLRECIGRWSLT